MKWSFLRGMALLFLFFFFGAGASPPKKIPFNKRDHYTLSGKIPVIHNYRNDTYPSSEPKFYAKEDVEKSIRAAKQRKTGYYGQTDSFLYKALHHFNIEKKRVAIIGSTTPWYEAIVLAYGGFPTTIEYNAIKSDHPSLTFFRANDPALKDEKFDVIFSISSIEHDGLGRYGDPIDPFGDLKSMKRMKMMLRDEGLLFLSMPVGADALVWNLHRIYGPISLPKLLRGWHLVQSFGFKDDLYQLPLGEFIQPIFVLKKDSQLMR